LYPDYGTTLISMSSLIFFIAHPPMAFISNYIIETKGIKFGVITRTRIIAMNIEEREREQ